MIKAIELRNWRTHRSTRLDFQKGVNVLIGVMGAGKSSVMDAISFGLFGTFPALNHKRASVESLISNRPTMQDDAEVSLEFVVGPDTYRVTRKITRNGASSATLNKNGAYLQAQPARVNEEIGRILKIDYDTFSRAIYAEQNRLDYFLELTKGDRKRQIDQMLGLDTFARAEENATSLLNSIKAMVQDESEALARMDLGEMRSGLERLSSERAAIESAQKHLSAQSIETKARVEDSTKKLSELKSRYERSKQLSREAAELSSRIDTLRREIERIAQQGLDEAAIAAEFSKRKAEAEALDAEASSLKRAEQLSLRKVAEAASGVKDRELKEKERDRLVALLGARPLEKVSVELKVAEEEKQRISSELAAKRAQAAEADKAAKELATHLGKCPVCDRELTEETRSVLLKGKSDLLATLSSEAAVADKGLKDSSAAVSRLTDEQRKAALATAKLDELKGITEGKDKLRLEEESERAKLAEVTSKIESISKRSIGLKEENARLGMKLDQARRKAAYVAEVAKDSALLDARSAEIKAISVDEKMIYSLQESLTADSSLLSDATAKLGGNERLLASISQQIDERAKQIARLNEMGDRIEARREQIANLNKFRGALSETGAALRNRLVTSINGLMQNLWPEVYPYADYSGIRLNAKKDDYLLEASPGAAEGAERGWMEVNGMASGGERSIACLTMRIAMAMVIVPNLRWLILDEPTHNLDENGISRFIDVLGNSLPRVVEQIFIITHDAALKNISSARVYQLNRNKDRLEHTVANEL